MKKHYSSKEITQKTHDDITAYSLYHNFFSIIQ